MPAGIETRHSRGCRSRQGGRCDCEPTYQANVWDGKRGKRIRKTFTAEAEAKGWRHDALIALRRGKQPDTSKSPTLREACEAWQDGAKRGAIRTRSGDPY